MNPLAHLPTSDGEAAHHQLQVFSICRETAFPWRCLTDCYFRHLCDSCLQPLWAARSPARLAPCCAVSGTRGPHPPWPGGPRQRPPRRPQTSLSNPQARRWCPEMTASCWALVCSQEKTPSISIAGRTWDPQCTHPEPWGDTRAGLATSAPSLGRCWFYYVACRN